MNPQRSTNGLPRLLLWSTQFASWHPYCQPQEPTTGCKLSKELETPRVAISKASLALVFFKDFKAHGSRTRVDRKSTLLVLDALARSEAQRLIVLSGRTQETAAVTHEHRDSAVKRLRPSSRRLQTFIINLSNLSSRAWTQTLRPKRYTHLCKVSTIRFSTARQLG